MREQIRNVVRSFARDKINADTNKVVFQVLTNRQPLQLHPIRLTMTCFENKVFNKILNFLKWRESSSQV